jgi:hypothetical protein
LNSGGYINYPNGVAPSGNTCATNPASASASSGNYFYSCATGLGVVTHTIGSPRQIQMSLALTF